ncbi:MAG: hypothetical protein GY786_18195 [Proteobacteria bacterium]|nr:hypothetical protein [Pseudomonadota bacterium]
MDSGEVHPGQNFLDNIWILTAIGIGFPTVSYLVWGLIDILGTPPLVG